MSLQRPSDALCASLTAFQLEPQLPEAGLSVSLAKCENTNNENINNRNPNKKIWTVVPIMVTVEEDIRSGHQDGSLMAQKGLVLRAVRVR